MFLLSYLKNFNVSMFFASGEFSSILGCFYLISKGSLYSFKPSVIGNSFVILDDVTHFSLVLKVSILHFAFVSFYTLRRFGGGSRKAKNQ